MSERFNDLKKIPDAPASRILAMAQIKLGTELSSPANASVQQVLEELEAADAPVDILLLLAFALPARESVWWACLAARDLTGPGKKAATPSLKAAEAWVFSPTPENRENARVAMETAFNDDDTSLCAVAAFYAEGNMGEGDMAEIEAPPAALGAAVFGMNMEAMGAAEDFVAHMEVVTDRALDIARGGNGTADAPATEDADAPADKGAH
ncbi:DUF6931 family protein [Candidatus Halocynthiibacter alkanivorans]|uniref:DUF6931 family protein n=1 Tax=Candidatus Halocynthiibacter alkanivorans TaxID=2267619 RepID=UPI000DF2C749|nr:hypothetical protein [Candidatus Halocynthiibacter alkanivorans]